MPDNTNRKYLSKQELSVVKRNFRIFNLSVFFQPQLFLLPFLLLFYQSCGLTVGDFFLFQGVFSLAALLFEIPMGYLGDIFPKKNVLILSYTFYVIRCILWLFFARYGYWIILIGEILFAAQKTTFTGVADSYIYEYLKRHNIPQKMAKHYGTMNFFMAFGTAFSVFISAPIYTVVSKYTLTEYGHNYAFFVLISLELILNLAAIGLLSRLPTFSQTPLPIGSLEESYKRLFRSVTWMAQNKNIRYHVFYSGLLNATPLVFAWSFQPIMKLLLFPVSLYGVVYFMNHSLRAFSSLCIDKIGRFISLSKMSALTFILFIIGFASTLLIVNIKEVSVYWALFYFFFISFAIGIQLAFRLLCDCRLHTFIPSEMRSTLSSVNTATSRLYAAFFFVLMKILLDGASIQSTFVICLIIFVILSFPLKDVYAIQAKEDKYAKK